MTDLAKVCDRVQEQLSAYLDSRLGTDELARIRTHLDGCDGCRAERQALERTDALVAAAVSDHPFGDAFVSELLGKLPVHTLAAAPVRGSVHAEGSARSRPVGIGFAALAAGLLLAVGLNLTSAPPPSIVSAVPVVVAKAGVGLVLLGEHGGALADGAEVMAGDRVVAVQTPASLTLADGTRVDLHADTEVALVRDADGGLTVAFSESEGKVFCHVAKQSAAPFRVRVRGLEVSVLGTQFIVEQRNASSSVTVVEGRVLAEARADRRTLGAGDQAEAFPHVGSGRLGLSRVTARRHGLWVPQLAAEQARIDANHVEAAPLPLPVPPPAIVPAGTPEQPGHPGMDQPIVPPTFGDK
jgi:ferric-dicitrate binding protein FerR (iron transport regulator)